MRSLFVLLLATAAFAEHGEVLINGHPVRDSDLTGETYRKEVVRVECALPGGIRLQGNAQPSFTSRMSVEQRKAEAEYFRQQVALEAPLLRELERAATQKSLRAEHEIEAIIFSNHIRSAIEGPDDRGLMYVNPEQVRRPGQLEEFLASLPAGEKRRQKKKQTETQIAKLQAQHRLELGFDLQADPRDYLPVLARTLSSVNLADKKIKGIQIADPTLYVEREGILYLGRADSDKWREALKAIPGFKNAEERSQYQAARDYTAFSSRILSQLGSSVTIDAPSDTERSRILASLEPVIRKHPKAERVWVTETRLPLTGANLVTLPRKDTASWETALAQVQSREQWLDFKTREAAKRCEVYNALSVPSAVSHHMADHKALFETYDRLLKLAKQGYRLSPRFSALLITDSVASFGGRGGRSDGTLMVPATKPFSDADIAKFFVKTKS